MVAPRALESFGKYLSGVAVRRQAAKKAAQAAGITPSLLSRGGKAAGRWAADKGRTVARASIAHAPLPAFKAEDIEEVISKMARVPVKTVNARDKEVLRSLGDELKAVVYGQEEAIEVILGGKIKAGDLINAVEQDGAQLLIVAFPARWQLARMRRARDAGEDLESARREIAALQARVAEVAAAHGTPLLDLLLPFLESEEDPFGTVDQGHPSAAGYRLTADDVYRALRNQGWL